MLCISAVHLTIVSFVHWMIFPWVFICLFRLKCEQKKNKRTILNGRCCWFNILCLNLIFVAIERSLKCRCVAMNNCQCLPKHFEKSEKCENCLSWKMHRECLRVKATHDTLRLTRQITYNISSSKRNKVYLVCTKMLHIMYTVFWVCITTKCCFALFNLDVLTSVAGVFRIHALPYSDMRRNQLLYCL